MKRHTMLSGVLAIAVLTMLVAPVTAPPTR